jgi:hypothetical protein
MILHNYIRKRSYDDVIFAEFDRNFNFNPDDILRDVVCSESHENCSPCWMKFIYNEITDS